MGLLDRLSKGQHVEPSDTVPEIQKKQTGSTAWNEADAEAARKVNESSGSQAPAHIRELLDAQSHRQLSPDERRELADWQMDQQLKRGR